MPRHHRRGREHSPILFTQHDKRPSAVSDMISFSASDGEKELICIMTNAVNELGLEWSPLRSHLAAGWRSFFSLGAVRATSALAGRAYSAAGQAASALHSMAVLQVFQAKMHASEEAGLDAASLRDLRSATDLALRATKATAQAIGHSMYSLKTHTIYTSAIAFFRLT